MTHAQRPQVLTRSFGQVQGGGDTIDVGALFNAIWRGKWLAALVAALALAAGSFYIFFVATPLYRSSAVVILETRQEQVVDLQSVVGGLSGETSVVNSEVEVLRGRGLMEKLVARLDLTRDPEFNAALSDGGFGARLRARVGLPGPGGAQLPAADQAQRELDATIDVLLQKTKVRNIPLSLVFEITVVTEDPRKSAQIADALAELYILNQLEVKFEATQQATAWLTDRVTALQAELELAEAKVKAFSAGTELINAQTLQALERQLKELRDRIANTEAATGAAQTRLAALASATGRGAQAEAASDQQLSRVLQRLNATADEALSAAFDTRFAQLLARAGLDLRRAQAQLAALKTSRDDLALQIERQSRDLIALQQLTREAEASRLLYEYFLSRLKETSAQQGIQQADSRILSGAVVPEKPSAPRTSLILTLSGFFGLMLGLGLVLLREARQSTYRSGRDLERETGYTLMGQIPLLPAGNRGDVLSYFANKPTSAAAEAIRNLRTSVLLSNADNPPQVIVSTSALPGEGKTTLALALAQNLTGMGKKVLLIEGDIRRSVFSQYLKGAENRGILAVLSGAATLEEVVLREARIGADVLLGEKSPTSAADLFSSQSFAGLLRAARAVYDVIIIDTPPVLVVPDARIIGQSADAILFAVKWDSTTKSQVEEALHMFETVNLKVAGLVLGQINPRGMKRYGHAGDYGAYSDYGQTYYAS